MASENRRHQPTGLPRPWRAPAKPIRRPLPLAAMPERERRRRGWLRNARHRGVSQPQKATTAAWAATADVTETATQVENENV
jgi:hypothetical protein